MNRRFLKRGGAWVLAQAALMLGTMVVAPVWADAWDGVWSKIVALVLGMFGTIFSMTGVLVLGRRRTVFPEPLPEARLVTTGIYGIVRHPPYTSVILLFLAWALWWRSVPALVLAWVSKLELRPSPGIKRVYFEFLIRHQDPKFENQRLIKRPNFCNPDSGLLQQYLEAFQSALNLM